MADTPRAFKRQLPVATISFALCFAVWGLIAAFAPLFQQRFDLSAIQVSGLVAAPVLLGSLGRIPAGMLADRFGGRIVFSALMLLAAVPTALVPLAPDFSSLLILAFILGLAGTSFAVGAGFVTQWAPRGRQGEALGIYGLGNIGHSFAVFLGPLLAGVIGWEAVFHGTAALLAVWAVGFALLARNAPSPRGPGDVQALVRVLRHEPQAWALSVFYFLTFGGFVAFAIYLPILLAGAFELPPADAGFRTAGFVILATLIRPTGGRLADILGGGRVLSGVFLGIVPFALLLSWPELLPFSIGALGCAALFGIGNGAVFQLVAEHFPVQAGTVSGLVGAMGGLGGFFPPLLLGLSRDFLGIYWPGFVLLAALALVAWRINESVFVPPESARKERIPPELTRTMDRLQATSWATLVTSLLVAAIFVGSRNLLHFDAALIIYTFATVFACWGIVYHYRVWLQRPPTAMYWRRGWQLARRSGVWRGTATVIGDAGRYLLAQGFIAKRDSLRWWMHQMLFWGCLLAAMVTFPLVFGWIHFGTLPDDQMTYVAYLFGFPTASFRLHTGLSRLIFHVLNVAAVLVLGGIFLSLWRRLRDRGAMAVQTVMMDFVPLTLLFAISITGMALTASALWLQGGYYGFLALTHAVFVIVALLYLPFGKFFHIFQRPAQLGVKLYQRAGAQDEGAHCTRCRQRFASWMHIEDLKTVLPQLGFDYATDGDGGHWQAFCPPCKRITLASAHLQLKALPRG